MFPVGFVVTRAKRPTADEERCRRKRKQASRGPLVEVGLHQKEEVHGHVIEVTERS